MKLTGMQAADTLPHSRPRSREHALSASLSGKVTGLPRRTATQLNGDSTPQPGAPASGCCVARSRCARLESAISSSIGMSQEIVAMARATVAWASSSESAISSASTSCVPNASRSASARNCVIMLLKWSAIEFRARASWLISSLPPAGQRTPRLPDCMALATSRTRRSELRIDADTSATSAPVASPVAMNAPRIQRLALCAASAASSLAATTWRDIMTVCWSIDSCSAAMDSSNAAMVACAACGSRIARRPVSMARDRNASASRRTFCSLSASSGGRSSLSRVCRSRRRSIALASSESASALRCSAVMSALASARFTSARSVACSVSASWW